MKTVLVVVAHPDDEVLGCGGTIAKLVKDNYRTFTLILGEGITSRDSERRRKVREEEIKELKACALRANKILGVEDIFFFDLPDNRFDTVPFLNIVKIVEEVINRIKPSVVFTHHRNDLNIDHRITYKAVITAARPMQGCPVKEIYSCEVLSSTEWNYPISFSPNYFVDISDTLDIKLKAMKEYKQELREYPHPRSLKGIERNAEVWGMKVGLKYAEAFEVVRCVK
ncbi:PIG-L deacetylase family protein [Hydrogenivirga sp.]